MKAALREELRKIVRERDTLRKKMADLMTQIRTKKGDGVDLSLKGCNCMMLRVNNDDDMGKIFVIEDFNRNTGWTKLRGRELGVRNSNIAVLRDKISASYEQRYRKALKGSGKLKANIKFYDSADDVPVEKFEQVRIQKKFYKASLDKNGILKYKDEVYMSKINLGMMTAVQKKDIVAEVKHWLTNEYEHWLKNQIRERGTVTKEDIQNEFELRGVRVCIYLYHFIFIHDN